MKKYLLFFGLIFASLVPLAVQAQTQDTTELLFFYGEGCPHCARMEDYLSTLLLSYPEVEVSRHEIYYDEESRALFFDMLALHGQSDGGVPTIFIDDEMIVGSGSESKGALETAIQRCQWDDCISPLTRLAESTNLSDVEVVEPAQSNSKTFAIVIEALIVLVGLAMIVVVARGEV